MGVKVGVFPSNFVSMVENASPVLANRRSQSGIITTTSSATAHAALQAAAAEAAAAEAAAADSARAAAEAAAIQQAAGPVKLSSAGSLSASKIYSQSRETLLSEKDAPILPPKPGMTITTYNCGTDFLFPIIIIVIQCSARIVQGIVSVWSGQR